MTNDIQFERALHRKGSLFGFGFFNLEIVFLFLEKFKEFSP